MHANLQKTFRPPLDSSCSIMLPVCIEPHVAPDKLSSVNQLLCSVVFPQQCLTFYYEKFKCTE